MKNYYGAIFAFCDIIEKFVEFKDVSNKEGFFPYLTFGHTDVILVKRTIDFSNLRKIFDFNDNLAIKSLEHIIISIENFEDNIHINGEKDIFQNNSMKIMSIICSPDKELHTLIKNEDGWLCPVSWGGNYMALFFHENIQAHLDLSLSNELVFQRFLCLPIHPFLQRSGFQGRVKDCVLTLRLKRMKTNEKESIQDILDGLTIDMKHSFCLRDNGDCFINIQIKDDDANMVLQKWFELVRNIRNRGIECISHFGKEI